MRTGTLRLLGSIVSVVIFLALFSCSGQRGVDPDPKDGPSAREIRAEDVRDAQPRSEPLARYGNHSPYEVFGKKYFVMASSEGYQQRGTASWYGSKFHGRRTSSGDKYDMHLATAAHKTLPLPTYAEVTNLANGRKVIVKINDRGPFKDNRIIDLSYAAALKLDIIRTGTAPVEVRAIEGGSPYRQAAVAVPDMWLQVGAFSAREGAEDLARRLRNSDLKPVSMWSDGKLYRVRLGPYGSYREKQAVIERAIELGFERPHNVPQSLNPDIRPIADAEDK